MMKQDIKNNRPLVQQNLCYVSPSVRVISLKTSHAILTVSNNIWDTDPAEMDDQNVF